MPITLYELAVGALPFPGTDPLQLIRDQSVTMRDPQQINDHLESLVHDVEQTEETVREVESIFSVSAIGIGDDLESEAMTRSRVRN